MNPARYSSHIHEHDPFEMCRISETMLALHAILASVNTMLEVSEPIGEAK